MSDVAIVTAPTISEDFEQARIYLQAAKASVAQGVAFMILAGAELERLHKAHGIHVGRPNSATGGGIKWEEIVQRELEISETTARRYRDMFKAARKRVPMLNAAELLKTPIGELPALTQAKLLEATRKVTDGQTAKQLMMEWGIAKKDQGSGARGGLKTPKSDTEPTADDAAAVAELARTQTDRLIALLEEALLDKPYNAGTKEQRKKLHGLCIDLAAEAKGDK